MDGRRGAESPLAYVTDGDGVITAVGGAWSAFARANGAPELAHGVGVSIWESMASSDTRQVYRHLLSRARPGAPLVFDYRCNAPGQRRDMRMRVTAVPGGGWEFESRALHAAPLPAAMWRLLRRAGDALDALRVCSWCNRVRDDERGWTEFEEFAVEAGLLLSDRHPSISHGICQDCHDRLLLPEPAVRALA